MLLKNLILVILFVLNLTATSVAEAHHDEHDSAHFSEIALSYDSESKDHTKTSPEEILSHLTHIHEYLLTKASLELSIKIIALNTSYPEPSEFHGSEFKEVITPPIV